jgi:hypothetical protein
MPASQPKHVSLTMKTAREKLFMHIRATASCIGRVSVLVNDVYHRNQYIFIEWRFGLSSLTYRDANANNLLNAFDFSQNPNPPHVIPLSKQELESIAPFIELGMGD